MWDRQEGDCGRIPAVAGVSRLVEGAESGKIEDDGRDKASVDICIPEPPRTRSAGRRPATVRGITPADFAGRSPMLGAAKASADATAAARPAAARILLQNMTPASR